MGLKPSYGSLDLLHKGRTTAGVFLIQLSRPTLLSFGVLKETGVSESCKTVLLILYYFKNILSS